VGALYSASPMAGPEIPAEVLATKILDIPESTYRDWLKARLVVRMGIRCTENEAVQAAIVQVLFGQRLDADDVRVVMEGLRKDLPDSFRPGRMRVVCHLRGRTGNLVIGDSEAADSAIGKAVSTGRRLLVLEVGADVGKVREAFQNEVIARTARSSGRRPPGGNERPMS